MNSLLDIGRSYAQSSDEDDLEVDQNVKLKVQVKDFLKQVEAVTGKQVKCDWEECFDDRTGFPYYWNTETNEVTWQMPDQYSQWIKSRSAVRSNCSPIRTQIVSLF